MEKSQYKDFWSFLKLLSDNDLLSHVIIVGSWAEYLYAQAGILPGFTANLRTLDIDFLVKNMKKPMPAASITALAREAGYTVDHDVLQGTTKIYTPDLMEIEFLILQQGSGEMSILKTNLGVNAQALRHMTVLRDFTVTVCLLDMEITIPRPEAYVLQKIIINEQRGIKAEKDRAAILNLLPFINTEELKSIYNTLTKKEQRGVSEFLSANTGIELPVQSKKSITPER